MKFSYGDLVEVDGYEGYVFKVSGYRKESWYYPDEEWQDIIYEVFDVYYGTYIEADIEDMTIVAEAVDAESYLAANPAPVEAPRMPGLDFDLSEFFGGGEVMKPRKPTARELSSIEAEKRKAARKEKAARIDDLLDQRNWYSTALERTNNEEFGDRVFAIDAELKKMTDE